MAKEIFCSEERLRGLVDKLIEKFRGKKVQSDDLNITLSLIKDERRAKVYFSARAWTKMYALVDHFSTEVQWHGTVHRMNENTFVIDDILIFPHTVTASTVVSDLKEYEEWKDNLDDETFEALRFHGHSHVNMQVHPSGTDMKVREGFLNNLHTPQGEDDDSFYIFFITNKKGDVSGQIYDLKYNALYDSDDIDFLHYIDEDSWVTTLLDEADKVVTTSTYNYNKPSSNYPGFYGGGTTHVSSGGQQNNEQKQGKKKQKNAYKGGTTTASIYDVDEDDDDEDWGYPRHSYYGGGVD